METKELFRLAINSLRSNKLRSFLTTLGIIIGVLSVILLVSLGTGLQAYITKQINEFGSNLIFIIPGDYDSERTGGGLVNKLEIVHAELLKNGLRSVASVAPITQTVATIKYGNKDVNKTGVFGTSSEYADVTSLKINSGRYFSPSQERSGSRVVLIGYTIKDKFFKNSNPIGKSIIISNKKYTVIGTLEKRGAFFGVDQDNAVYVPISAVQKQFGLKNVNSIYISAKDAKLINYVKAQSQKILLKRLKDNEFSIQSQEQALELFNSITSAITAALGGIAAISLIVGGIGVMNIMLVSVTERTKEIGLRKALGAKRSDILKQFLLEAVILSLAGGIIGILLGLGVSYILAQFFVSEVTLWSVLLAFFFSVAVGVIFGMAPAIRASQLSPIEALRYE